MTSRPIGRPVPDENARYFDGYIARVPEEDILSALSSQQLESAALLSAIPKEKESHRYAEGKWMIRQLVGHIVDAERIFGYRALCIARGEKANLPGFAENEYARNGGFETREIASLARELSALRDANRILFESLSEEAWNRRGSANGNPVSVRALAYVMVGHERHHLSILKERYL